MAAQWSSAASLDRWIGQRCGRRPPPPCRVSAPAVSPSRWTRRKGPIGCVSGRAAAEAEQTSAPAVSPSRWTRRKGPIGCVSARAAAEAEQTARPEVVAEMEEEGVVCEECSGTGWLLCDFCKGKKKNVKSESSRIYRRCPTCKAAGYILCPRCRVYKCITFPESSDS